MYVDDIEIGGNNGDAIKKFNEYLSQCFHMKDLGVLKYFLRVEVNRNKEGMFLCQHNYVLDIITEARLLGANPAGFPMEQNHHLEMAESIVLADPEKYRRFVGRLIYLTLTRPELSKSVHVLGQFIQRLREEH